MIAPLVLLALFVGAWELYTRVSNVDAFILPAPHEVAQSLWDDRSLLLSNLSVTAQEVGLGVVLALLVGVLLAFALHLSPPLRRAAYPLLVSSQAVPFVILAPLLETARAWAATVVLALFAVALFGALGIAQRVLVPWTGKDRT